MIGILLVNLGTPNSPLVRDVKRYLNEFLSDPRVIELPTLKRLLLVRGLIVPFRSRSSAKTYKEIWTERGSPLKYYGEDVADLLQNELGDRYQVELAMRYQEPSIEDALNRLRGCDELIVFPLFPQYSSTTTGSVHQEVMRLISKWPIIPRLNFIDSFPTNEGMIEAFAENASEYNLDEYTVLMSFHGLPVKADYEKRYSRECQMTAEALANKLGITDYYYCYQSRLGNNPWLKPYTIDVIRELKGKKLLVFCPAFVCDCLETLYEIGVEYAEEADVTLVPGLNTHPKWIQGLRRAVERCS